MPTVMTSTVLDAPATTVWSLLRDFAAIGSWHPYLTDCVIENGPADRVGCARVFPSYSGHRETLTGLDDRNLAIAYRFDDSAGLPVRDYHCVLQVRPLTVSGRAVVEWSARYDADSADEPAVAAQVRDFLDTGLAALAQRFSPATTTSVHM